MKIKELIEKLKDFDEDLEVFAFEDDMGQYNIRLIENLKVVLHDGSSKTYPNYCEPDDLKYSKNTSKYTKHCLMLE